jgi:hypothetical protein
MDQYDSSERYGPWVSCKGYTFLKYWMDLSLSYLWFSSTLVDDMFKNSNVLTISLNYEANESYMFNHHTTGYDLRCRV